MSVCMCKYDVYVVWLQLPIVSFGSDNNFTRVLHSKDDECRLMARAKLPDFGFVPSARLIVVLKESKFIEEYCKVIWIEYIFAIKVRRVLTALLLDLAFVQLTKLTSLRIIDLLEKNLSLVLNL